MSVLTLSFLGTFDGTLDHEPLSSFRSSKARALLAYLVIESHQAHPRRLLGTLFWPDSPESQSQNSMRVALRQARLSIRDQDADPPFLLINRQTVQSNAAASIDIDVHRFESLLAANEPSSRRQAIALYKGDFLAGFSLPDSPDFETWMLLKRAYYERLALAALAQETDHCMAQEQYADAQRFARRQLELDEWRESAHRQLMDALAHSGERNAALAQYERCRQLLWEDLGVAPESATTELFEAIQLASSTKQQGQTASKPLSSLQTEPPSNEPPALAFEDWGEMPTVATIHGRDAEIEQLIDWIETEHARLVAILGIGGQGKTTLAATYARSLLEQPKQQPFEQVIWRSLLHAPPLKDVLQSWLGILVDESKVSIPQSLDESMGLLFQILRGRRVLLILDNMESILAAGETAGSFRSGYDAYGQLFNRMGESDHQSCLLLTSREQPPGMELLERRSAAVHTLPLDGLSVDATVALLDELFLDLEGAGWQELVTRYSGNPLALLMVADTIDGLFDGNVAAFLSDEGLIFDDVRAVLDEQFARLTALERDILIWLAIEREGVPVLDLRENLLQIGSQRTFLDALRSLQRRSLLIRRHSQDNSAADAEAEADRDGDGIGTPRRAQPGDLLTMQNVIIEYTTGLLIDSLCDEIQSGKYNLFFSHALLKANGKEYVRNSQQRLILDPLANRLMAELGQSAMTQRSTELLQTLRQNPYARESYAAGNLLNLLIQMKMAQMGGEWSGIDFSNLTIRHAYLRDQTVRGVNFSNSEFVAPVFTDTFSNVRQAAFSPDGQLLAGVTSTGVVRLWSGDGQQPVAILTGHSRLALCVAWRSDGHMIASGGEDGTVRLWEKKAVQPVGAKASGAWHGRILHSGSEIVRTVAFRPAKHGERSDKDRRGQNEIVATAGNDPRIRLWSVSTGEIITTLSAHSHVVSMVAFSPEGDLLVSCSADGSIRVWALDNLELMGKQGPVDSLRQAPGAESAQDRGMDEEVPEITGRVLLQLPKDALEVWTVAFSPDGSRLAAGSLDGTIWVWSVEALRDTQRDTQHDTQRSAEGPLAPAFVLKEHQQSVQQLAFSPDGRMLASGGDDRLIRLWNVETGGIINTLQGHTDAVLSVAFRPGGNMLASGSMDGTLRFWNPRISFPEQTLSAYAKPFNSVAIGPTPDLLVTASGDNNIRIWEQPALPTFPPPKVGGAGGGRAGGGQTAGSEIEEPPTRALAPICRHVLSGHEGMIWSMAVSPDGRLAASVSEDRTVTLWDMENGRMQGQLRGHEHIVTSVDFSPDGRFIASGSIDQTCRLWSVATGDCMAVLDDGTGIYDVHNAIWSVAVSPDSRFVAAGFGRGAIILWDASTGEIGHILSSHADWVRGLAFTPDGKFLVSGSNDHSVRIWDLTAGKVIQQLDAHTDWVMAVAMHPSGRLFASTGHDQTIRLWEMDEAGSAEPSDVLTEHSGSILAIDFSGDGSLLASASTDETVKFWDVARRTPLHSVRTTGPYEQINIAGVTGLTEAQRLALLRLGAVE